MKYTSLHNCIIYKISKSSFYTAFYLTFNPMISLKFFLYTGAERSYLRIPVVFHGKDVVVWEHDTRVFIKCLLHPPIPPTAPLS